MTLRAGGRGPAVVSMAGLFFLNAAVAMSFGVDSILQDVPNVGLVTTAVDAPSGFLLIFLAACLWTGERATNTQWTGSTVATGVIASVASLAVFAVLLLGDPPTRSLVERALANGPVFLGYAFVLWILVIRLMRATDSGERLQWSLLLVAFGGRAVEFGTLYGQNLLLGPAGDSAVDAFVWVSKWVLALSAASATVLLARAAWRHRGAEHRALTMAMVGLLVAAMIGLVPRTGLPFFPIYLMSVLTLMVVRPIFVSLALDVQRTSAGVRTLVVAALVLLTSKALVGAAFGAPFLQVGALDLYAVAAAAFVLLAIHAAAARPRRGSPLLGGEVPSPRARQAHLLIDFLLARGERAADLDQPATAAEIERATGIPRPSVARVARQAEQLLVACASNDDGPLVLVAQKGVRGRRTYGLSPMGTQAARKFRSGGRAAAAGRTPPRDLAPDSSL